MLYENENTEFKSALTGDIYKEVIAFANNGGGVIYIGVDIQGSRTGYVTRSHRMLRCSANTH